MSSNIVLMRNPGLLDVRGITTFGLNAKPNTKSPIGYFGTGLKYAIATLVRNNIPIRLFIGNTEYEFSTKEADFRGSAYTQVRMRVRSLTKGWYYKVLPFTTELGRNWEVWQAFRELESNRRDEGGETQPYEGYINGMRGEEAQTKFYIGPSQAFADCLLGVADIFLPNAERIATSDDLQIFQSPAKHIYYRGIRIFDLTKPSLLTYNFLGALTLTEDRTVKYEWDIQDRIVRYLISSRDKKIINHLLNATDDNWESQLPFDQAYSNPSEEFMTALAARKRRITPAFFSGGSGNYISPRLLSLYDNHQPKVASTTTLVARFKQWWSIDRADQLSDLDEELMREVQTQLERYE